MCYGRCVSEVGLRELRQNASDLVKRVEAGETFTVTVSGRAAAVLMPVTPPRWRTWDDVGHVLISWDALLCTELALAATFIAASGREVIRPWHPYTLASRHAVIAGDEWQRDIISNFGHDALPCVSLEPSILVSAHVSARNFGF